MEDFAIKLKRLRLEHGLTQAELAEKLFVSKQAVSKWENAKGMPDVEILPKIAAVLEVNLDLLMSDENIEASDNGDSGNIQNEAEESAGNGDTRINDAAEINGAADNAANGNDNVSADGMQGNDVQGSPQDNAAQANSYENGRGAGKPEKNGRGSRRLARLIYICIPVLIVVIVATVLLSVYLPEKTPENPPVTDTPPVEEDLEPAFTEIRAMGEDYHLKHGAGQYDFKSTGMGGKSYFRFAPSFSSEYTFTLTTDPEKAEGFFRDAKVILYIDGKAVAEKPCGEILEHTIYLEHNLNEQKTYDIVVEMLCPNNYGGSFMSGTLQVEYKHDFENVTVPAKSSYTVALPATDYVTDYVTNLTVYKNYMTAKTFQINNENLYFTSVDRMELLDPSLEIRFSADAPNYFWDEAVNYHYMELILSLDDYNEYNNEFYYITITNDSDEPTSLNLKMGDAEELKRGNVITMPDIKGIKDDECKYKIFKLNLWEETETGGIAPYNLFYATTRNFNADIKAFSRRGEEYHFDSVIGSEFNYDGWYGTKTNMVGVCYVKLRYTEEPYQFYVKPYKQNKS